MREVRPLLLRSGKRRGEGLGKGHTEGDDGKWVVRVRKERNRGENEETKKETRSERDRREKEKQKERESVRKSGREKTFLRENGDIVAGFRENAPPGS